MPTSAGRFDGGGFGFRDLTNPGRLSPVVNCFQASLPKCTLSFGVDWITDILAQDVTLGMREAASRGFFLGSKAPLGYRRIKLNVGGKEQPTLEVDPATAPVAKEIFESRCGATVSRRYARS